MLCSTELTLLLPQVGSQAQKSIGDMPEMIRDCGYFAFCAIKSNLSFPAFPPGAVQQLKLLPRMGSTSHFLHPREDNKPTSRALEQKK